MMAEGDMVTLLVIQGKSMLSELAWVIAPPLRSRYASASSRCLRPTTFARSRTKVLPGLGLSSNMVCEYEIPRMTREMPWSS